MDRAFFELMRLVSPSLPVGGFAYSQALEAAVEKGLILDEAQTGDWISGVLKHSIAQLDLPCIFHLYSALERNDLDEFVILNQTVIAHRETRELRDEARQMGSALLSLLRNTEQMYKNIPKGVRAAFFDKSESVELDWASAFSLAAYISHISRENTACGYAWAWCENQVIVAIKLVPLGQTQGQRLLISLADQIPALVERSLQIDKEHIGGSMPNQAILSCMHETQYSRLFRS